MPTVIGLDLGKHTFRGVEIDNTKKGTVIIKSSVYDNVDVELDENSGDSVKQFAAKISDFIKEASFSTSRVVIALEEKDVFMRVITVPKMNDKELRSSIAYEAEQYIPVPIKEVNLSYQRLELPASEQDKINVQLVAAKKSVIERYVSLVKIAKLTPVGIEPEALAISRALAELDNPMATLILHMGFEKSVIIISFKGALLFSRTLALGGDTLTKTIQQQMSLDYMQAEEYKKTYGLNADQAEGRIYEVLQPLFNNIIGEINRAQIFFTTHTPGVNINKVILSGGTALMPGLLLYMANNLSLEVELANPFKNCTFSKEASAKAEWYATQGPSFSAPVGLALKEV